MVCLGFEPRAAGWQAQTKPRSYGGYFFTPTSGHTAILNRPTQDIDTLIYVAPIKLIVSRSFCRQLKEGCEYDNQGSGQRIFLYLAIQFSIEKFHNCQSRFTNFFQIIKPSENRQRLLKISHIDVTKFLFTIVIG